MWTGTSGSFLMNKPQAVVVEGICSNYVTVLEDEVSIRSGVPPKISWTIYIISIPFSSKI